MNISNIRPDNPTIAIEGQATGETPVNVTPEGWTAPKRSNYDKVKAMNIEKLADWLCHIVSNGTVNCGHCIAEEFCRAGHNGMLDFLKQEAKE